MVLQCKLESVLFDLTGTTNSRRHTVYWWRQWRMILIDSGPTWKICSWSTKICSHEHLHAANPRHS